MYMKNKLFYKFTFIFCDKQHEQHMNMINFILCSYAEKSATGKLNVPNDKVNQRNYIK